MDAFITWVQATSLSHFIVFQIWVWPLCETLHFVGLALVIGLVGFFDLRLMGFYRRIPIDAVRELMPFAIAGFLTNLVTGVIFLIGHPEQYLHSWVWWMKVLFLAVAGLNAFVFELTVGKRLGLIKTGDDTPIGAKLIGAVSLVSWLGVLYWGRMLPFIGQAF